MSVYFDLVIAFQMLLWLWILEHVYIDCVGPVTQYFTPVILPLLVQMLGSAMPWYDPVHCGWLQWVWEHGIKSKQMHVPLPVQTFLDHIYATVVSVDVGPHSIDFDLVQHLMMFDHVVTASTDPQRCCGIYLVFMHETNWLWINYCDVIRIDARFHQVTRDQTIWSAFFECVVEHTTGSIAIYDCLFYHMRRSLYSSECPMNSRNAPITGYHQPCV